MSLETKPAPSITPTPTVKQKKIKKPRKPVLKLEVNEKVEKVYVWELPVRVFHWINAAAILLLLVTGFYIGRPGFSAGIPEEAYYSSLMWWMRYVHFFTAFVFTLNLVIRLYWVLKGNRFAKSKAYKKEFWMGTYETLKYYLFMKNKKKHYVGHNPLAELSYWIFIGLGSIIIIFTGFYMYIEPQPESILGNLFSWVPFIFGGDSFTVRSLHHIVAWGFVVFTILHVYMGFREDWLAKNGTMSSIFTGYKIEKKHHDEDEQ
ncbi:Ni/Fe-hydrogenase, b-type cytochrome subunit [Bacillaceae bacterium S4-13-56]